MTPGRYEVALVVDGRVRWETPRCRCRHVENVHGFARRAGVTAPARQKVIADAGPSGLS